jgi:hypothetical protein
MPHGRADPHADRIRSAQTARQAAGRLQLSGSHDKHSRTRTFLDVDNFRRAVTRDPRTNRLRIDWAQVTTPDE